MLHHELELAKQLCLKGGALAMRFRTQDNFDVEHKPNDLGPVTTADRAVERIIVDGLRQAFPDDTILAEESAPVYAKGPPRGRVWMIDPIDGTREFIAGRTEFAVMLGLAIDGEATLGVICQPAVRKLYYGVVGDGAFCVDGDGDAEAIHVSERTHSSDSRMMRSRSHPSEEVSILCNRLEIASWERMGSFGLKTAEIASGRAELYCNLSSATAFWDSCGPGAILKAAGGHLTEGDGVPPDYASEQVFHTGGTIVSNGKIHDHVVRAIAGMRAEGLL